MIFTGITKVFDLTNEGRYETIGRFGTIWHCTVALKTSGV